jgi:hypothetical protein
MKSKKIKKELYKILYKPVDKLTLTEWAFMHTYLTYEILESFIDDTGYAVDIEGFNTEEVYEINILNILQ